MRMLQMPAVEEGYERGKIVTPFKVQNYEDITRLAFGYTEQSPRSYAGDAVVDTGSVHLYLKTSVIKNLGLRPIRTWSSLTMSNQKATRRVFSPVDLQINRRSGTFEVVELPDELPNIIGQIPLEFMDWVIDMGSHQITGNPEHGGEWIDEEFTEIDGRSE